MTDLVRRFWAATEPREDGYALIAGMYRDEGLSFDAIQERIGCGRSTIDRALTAHNVERRPRSKPKGVKNRHATHIRKRNAQREAQRRVDCARCGLLLAEAPGCVAELCAICCEELSRGVVYDETREKVVALVEQLREVVA
jgi:transposase